MSAPTVDYDSGRDEVIVRDWHSAAIHLTRDEAQALAEALTDAVDDAERADGVGG